MPTFELIATCGFGLETIVRHEIEALGYEARVAQSGRVLFHGDESAIREANLWLRTAERILIRVATTETTDFGQLFDLARNAPWHEWVTVDGEFPVRGRSIKSQLSSVPACQRIVKKAIVEQLREAYATEELPETGPQFPIEVALLDDQASLLLDTTGVGLHKRGYRYFVGEAPLRETLAASMINLSRWRPEQPFWDPFCGSGTIAIEAALIGRNLAPGLNRDFLCETWPSMSAAEWKKIRDHAQRLAKPDLPEPILATDISPEALKLARRHAEAAGVAEDIHFQQRDFHDISSKRQYGCLITNPPYGERLGEKQEIEALYRSMPEVFRRLKSWSHYLITARGDFERLVGQRANKRRKLYNGRHECTFFQYHGPRPPKKSNIQSEQVPEKIETKVEAEPKAESAQAFGGLREESKRQAEEFANRIRKRARHLRRWPTKRGITCYRLYERDVPDVPLIVDRYEDALVVAEYDRPHERTPAEHGDWLDLMQKTLAETLEMPREAIFLKRRQRQQGESQYTRIAEEQAIKTVNEGGLKFQVNLSDYLDTGLFLDHRLTRSKVREEANGKRFLNLFAYTGSFTVYATDGGASETTTVDLSANYLEWAEQNLRLNNFDPQSNHEFIRADGREFVDNLPEESLFDLAIVDPPTFSNSKRTESDWDVQKDSIPLLNALAKRMSPGGVIYFSNNFRRFKFDESELVGLSAREISKQTVPEDFRNQRIHRCWRLVKEHSD